MAIRAIENIKINGSKRAFGGYVYHADLEVNLNKEPSRLTLNFISEDGTYSEPVLSPKTPYKIDIGKTISQNYYAVTFRETEGSGGSTLEVTFLDGSLILDRVWVGLHKRHGFNPKAKSLKHLKNIPGFIQNPYPENIVDNAGGAPSNMVIVGEEIHPCDLNQDGVFDEQDLAELVYDQKDVCDVRCNDEGVDVNALRTQCVNQTKTEVFEVKYRFSELLDAISKYVKIIQKPTLQNDFYKADYSGSLRQVLSEWCSLFGLSFFWENDGLNFVDISKQPKIQVPDFECIAQKTRTKTIEGTIARGSISHYSQRGQIIDRECSSGQQVSLHCLTLRDLYTDVWKPKYGDGKTGQPEDDPSPDPEAAEVAYKDDIYPNGVPIERLEEACVCSYYHQRIRELYILRNYYGLNEIQDFVNAKGKTLDRFGSMKVLRVFDQYNTDPTAGNAYNELIGDKNMFTPSQLEQFKLNEGFFVLARLDTRKLQDQFQQEENLATNFMGRHWIRAYHSPYYGTEPEVRPKGQYIGAGVSELKNATFSRFEHSNDSRVANLGQSLQIKPKLDANKKPLAAQQEVLKTIKSVIYYERPDGVWNPSRDTRNYFNTIVDKMEDSMPRVCSGASADKIKAYLQKELDDKTITKEDIQRGKIVVLAMFRGYFSMDGSFANNPFEENPAYLPIAQIPMAKVGLSSKRTVRYSVWGVLVDTPAGSSCRFDNDYDAPLLDPRHTAFSANFHLDTPVHVASPYYGVVVVQTRKPHVEIPKIEATFISPPIDSDALRIEYSVKSQIDDHTIRALNNLQKECVPDVKILQKAHEDFNKGLTFSVTTPYESHEFTVAGIDLPDRKASIATGLEGLSIRLDDKGVFSTYRIGNSLFTPINEDVLAKRLEFQLRLQRYQAPIFGNSIIPRKPQPPA